MHWKYMYMYSLKKNCGTLIKFFLINNSLKSHTTKTTCTCTGIPSITVQIQCTYNILYLIILISFIAESAIKHHHVQCFT